MEDKKRIIEEMAKAMCLYCKEMTEEKECERGKECFDWRLKEARFYCEQGYRKLPKDSVVLTREEYDEMCSIEWHNEQVMHLQDRIAELEKENKKLLDSIETVQNDRCVYKCELTKKHLKQFAERLKKYIDENQVQTTFFGGKCFIDKETIDETLKQIMEVQNGN